MRIDVAYNGELCQGCTYCCWALKATVVAGDLRTPVEKPPNSACHWLVAGVGCQIHSQLDPQSACARYACPWVMLQRPEWLHLVRIDDHTPFPWPVHRPDVFQSLLAEPWVEATGIMPAVPRLIPVDRAVALARQTRSILAARAVTDAFGSATVGFLVGCQPLARDAHPAAAELWSQEVQRACLPRAA